MKRGDVVQITNDAYQELVGQLGVVLSPCRACSPLCGLYQVRVPGFVDWFDEAELRLIETKTGGLQS